MMDQLQINAHRLSTIIAHLPGGIIIETPERTVQQVNQKFCEMFGIEAPPEALIGADCRKAAQQSKTLFKDEDGFISRIDEILVAGNPVQNEELLLKDSRVFERDYVPVKTAPDVTEHMWHYRDITERKREEKELLESEEKYRALVNNTQQGVVIAQSDPVRLSFVNPAMTEITGFEGDELLAMGEKELPVLIHPDDRPRFFGNFKKRIEGQDIPMRDEYRIVNKDGGTKWMSIYSSLIDYGGELATLTTFMDFTDHKKTEAALQESSKILQEKHDIFGAGTAVIFKWKNETGWPVEYVSENVKNVFGYSADEFINGVISYSEIIEAEDLERVGKEVSEASESGKDTFEHQPYRIKNKNGAIVWLLDYTNIIRNDNNEITHYMGYVVDISQQKESEEKYRTLIETSRDGIFIIVNRKIQFVNRELIKISGYDKEQLIGQPFINFVAPRERKKVLGYYIKRFAGKEVPDTYESLALTKSGASIPVLVSVIPIVYQGKKALQVVFRDISKQKKLQEEKEIFNNLLKRLSVSLSLKECAKIIADEARKLFRFDAFSFDVVDRGNNMLLGVYNQDTPPGKRNPVETPSHSHSLDEVINKDVLAGKLKLINRKEKPEKSEYYAIGDESLISMSLMFAPVLHKNETAAIISIQSYTKDFYNQNDLELLQSFTVQASGSLLRIQTEESLRNNRDYLNTILESVHTGVILVKRDNFTIAECNPIVEKLIGLKKKDIIGKICYEYFCPAQKGKCPVCNLEEEIENAEQILITASGKEIPILKTVIPLKLGEENYLLESFVDITERKRAEQTLNESEEKYREVVERANDGIIIVQDGIVKFTNAQLAELWGGSVDEIVGTPFPNFIHPDELNHIKENYRKRMAGEKIENVYETILLRMNGEPVNAEVSTGLISYKGKPANLVIIRDITERKRNEEELRISQQTNQAILRAIPDLMFGIDKDYMFQTYHAVEVEGLYTPPEVFLGKSVDEVLPQQLASLTKENVDKVLQNGEISNYEYELEIAGKLKFYDARMVIQEEDRVLTIVRDITEQKLAEKEKRESEEKYQRIFEESQDIIFVSNPVGRFLDINPAGVELFGYASLEEMQSLNIGNDLYKNPVDRERYLQELNKNGFVREYEQTLKKKDGSELIVSETTTAVYDEHKNITAYRGIMRDITDKKRLEAQLFQSQKMESIGALAGGVAHDFNNLLTVINGYADIALLKMKPDDPLHSEMTSILSAGKRAENLTRQLLAFSRKQIYKAEIVNVNEVISSLDKMLRRLIGEDISIERILPDYLPNIKADKSQLEQIFVNLVVNARDALYAVDKPGYQRKITIETGQVFLDDEYAAKHQGSETGQHIYIAVSDNGTGMDEQTKQQVFEPFFTTKEKGKGTGLGMATVYGIVKQNNGSIYVYSEPGEGTTFKIHWPVSEEENGVAKIQKSEKILRGSERILIVEDEKDVCKFAAESLTSLGYKIHTAENGRLALDLIKEKKPKLELIITDLIMPELNGKEFIDKAKKIYPDIKVIFVSGYTDNHIVHNGLLEEGVNFIQKPYSLRKLSSAIRKVLDER